MKSISAVLLAILLTGCETIANENPQSIVEARFIGVWEGEFTERDGTTKSWTQTRNDDGTYRIEFRFMETDGAISRFSETGRWWIKDGRFHEIVPSWMKRPDSYQYRFKDNRCITFLLIDSSESIEDIGTYRFIECRSEAVPSI